MTSENTNASKVASQVKAVISFKQHSQYRTRRRLANPPKHGVITVVASRRKYTYKIDSGATDLPATLITKRKAFFENLACLWRESFLTGKLSPVKIAAVADQEGWRRAVTTTATKYRLQNRKRNHAKLRRSDGCLAHYAWDGASVGVPRTSVPSRVSELTRGSRSIIKGATHLSELWRSFYWRLTALKSVQMFMMR